MQINKKSVFYNSLLLAGSSVVLQLMGFVYRIGISRIAGAQAMGIFQLIMPVYSVLTAFTLSGLTMAVSQITSKHMILGEKSEVVRTVQIAQRLFMLVFAFAAAVFTAFSLEIGESILGDSKAQQALLLLLPCLFLTGFENIYKACFHGIRKVKQPIISELLEHAVRIFFVLSLLLLLQPKDPYQKVALIVLGMIGGEVVSASLLAVFFKQQGFQKTKSIIGSKNTTSQILTIAIPLSLAGMCNNIISSATTLLIPKSLILYGLSSEEAVVSLGAMFGMTLPLLMLPSAFISPLITVIIPRISQGVALKNYGDIRRKAGKAIQVTGMISALFMAILVPLGRLIAIGIYKEKIAGDFIIPLAISAVFTFYHMVTGSILNGVGMQKKSSFSVIFVGVLQLALTWALVPRFGMGGFVYGMLLSDGLGALMNGVFVKSALSGKLRLRNWFIAPWVSGLFAGLLTQLTFDFLQRLTVSPNTAAVCAIVVCIITYLSALRFQGISFFGYIKKLFVNQK